MRDDRHRYFGAVLAPYRRPRQLGWLAYSNILDFQTRKKSCAKEEPYIAPFRCLEGSWSQDSTVEAARPVYARVGAAWLEISQELQWEQRWSRARDRCPVAESPPQLNTRQTYNHAALALAHVEPL